MKSNFLSRHIYLIMFAIFVSSCGGGGGGGGGTSSAQLPVNNDAQETTPWQVASNDEVNSFKTSEYNLQPALNNVKAAEAYALLEKNNLNTAGDGVEVLVIDSGIDIDNSELINNIGNNNKNYTSTDEDDIDDGHGHGTFVSSIIAAEKNDERFHGIAYNSTIITARTFDDNANGNLSSAINAANEYSTSNVKVMNLSLGYGTFSSYDGDTASASTTDLLVINTLKAAKNNDILVVVASGNDGDNNKDGQSIGADSEYLDHPKPGRPALFAANSELDGYVLAVGSVDNDNDISDFSNICGVTRNNCLVAPGGGVFGSNISNGTSSGSGTSYATPFVSGAAAVLRSAWPHLTARQTARILLLTATDLGQEGVDDIYGRGLLNLEEAVKDYGEDKVVAGLGVIGKGYSASSSSFESDPIFGDALSINSSQILQKAVFFDDFGRNYNANLHQKVNSNTARNVNLAVGNIINNQYQSKNIPFSFANSNKKYSTNIKISYRDFNENYQNYAFINQEARQNIVENSRSISFEQNFDNKIKIGFLSNQDQISTLEKSFVATNFISLNSFNSNPFQGFLSNSSFGQAQNNNMNQKQFNQIYFNHSFFENKVGLNFSHQSSFENSNSDLIVNRGVKQNEVNNFEFILKNKQDALSLSFGRLEEFDNNILNSKTSGVFQSGSNSVTSYFKVALKTNIIKDIDFLANYSSGQAEIGGNEYGVFRDFSDVKMRSFALGFLGDISKKSEIGFLYKQPLRIYNGKATLDIPVARNISGQVTRLRQDISLQPSGTQQDFELFINSKIDNNSYINFNFLAVKDLGNISNQELQYLGFMNFKNIF